jgi:hypothetical protein
MFNFILGWIILVIFPFFILVKIKPENTAYLSDNKRYIYFISLGLFALGIISSLLSLLQFFFWFSLPQFLSLWFFLHILMGALSILFKNIGLLSIVSTIVFYFFLFLAFLFSIGMIIFFVRKVKQIKKEFASFDISNIKDKIKNEPMVTFVRKSFRNFLEVILWINLIIFTIVGWNTGNTIKKILVFLKNIIRSEDFQISAGGYPFIGAFLGILVGLLLNIIIGGFIATITNIDKNLEILTGNPSGTKKPSCENSSGTEKTSLKINDNSANKEEQVERKTDLNSVNATINNNTGKSKLIVERLNNFICSSIPFEIFIDNKKSFSIKNASKFSGFIKNGIHSIYAAIDNNTKSEILKFNANNLEIKFRIRVLEIGKIKLEKII